MSGRSVIGGLVGAVAGFFFGGPAGAIAGAAIGFGGAAALELASVETPGYEGPRLDSLRVQTSSYGDPLKILHGHTRIAGSLIWMSDVREIATTTRTGGGGKGGGGGGQSQTTYTYRASVAIALCEGEITEIIKIWADTDLVYDVDAEENEGYQVVTANDAASGVGVVVRVFSGSETQTASSFLRSVDANQPAYRGTAYVVIEDLNLTNFGNRVPNFSFLTGTRPESPVELTDTTTFIHAERIPWAESGIPVIDDASHIWGAWANQRTLAQQRAFREGLPTNQAQYTNPLWWRNKISWGSPYHSTTYYSGVTGNAFLNTSGPDEFIDHDPYFIRSGFFQHAKANIIFNYEELPDTFLGLPGIDCDMVASLTQGTAGDGQTGYGLRNGGASLPGVWQRIGFGDFATFSAEIQDAYITTNNCLPSGEPAYQTMVTQQVTEIAWSGFREPVPEVFSNDPTGCVVQTQSVSQESGTFKSIRMPYFNSNVELTTPGVGPVLRNDDPNYNDQAFWEAALADAIADNPNNLPGTWIGGVPPNDPDDWPSWVYGVDYPVEVTVDGTEDPLDAIYGIRSFYANYCPAFDPENSGVLVRDIIAATLRDAGIDSSRFDVSSVEGVVVGYIVDKTMSARQAIAPLMQAFVIDAYESGTQLVFRQRGRSDTATLTEDVIGRDRQTDPVAVATIQDFELPKTLALTYIDPLSDFQKNTQVVTKDTARSSVSVDVKAPITMHDDTAAQRAEVLLHSQWAERQSVTFDVIDANSITLNPTDVVKLIWDGWAYQVRLTGVRYTAPAVLECSGVVQQYTENVEAALGAPTVYASSAVGIATSVTGQSVTVQGDTEGYYLDIPFTDTGVADEDLPGFFVGGKGAKPGWSAGTIWRSYDNGAEWSPVAGVTPAIVAGTTTLLSAGIPSIVDYSETITVTVSDELASITREQLLAGGNAALVGAHGRWEVIQFQTATLVSEGVYELTGLLRGRLGTEWAMGGHQAGDDFIVLENIYNVPIANSRVTTEMLLRAVTANQYLEDVDYEAFTPAGVRLKPYAPVHGRGTRDGSGNLALTWQRRDRAGSQALWQAPQSEATESYEIDVMDGASVARTITASTESAAYSAADQVTDFGSAQGAVTVRIYQLSALVGRGYAGEFTV